MTIILMYHRVAALQRDPYGLAVRPEHFAAHVGHLRALGSVIPLSEALHRGPRPRIAITFDDGYADNATLAAPMLADAGLPATWFITAAQLGRRRFWWDRLAECLLGDHEVPGSVDLEIGGRQLWLNLRMPEARAAALQFIHRRLLTLSSEAVASSVDAIVDALRTPTPADDALTMTPSQLRSVAALPLQKVGAHTRTHVHLAGQPVEVQREEIHGSVKELSSLLGYPVEDFAYPFGGPGTVGKVAPRLAEEAGCRLACTTVPGPVRRRSTPYLLPRVTVGDWDCDEFAHRLNRALSR